MTPANAVTRHILEYILLLGGFAWRNNVGAHRVGRRYIRYGYPGSGDVLAVVRGRFYSIEVKVGRDRLRPTQRQWIELVERAGGVCLVAHTVQDVQDYFEPEAGRGGKSPFGLNRRSKVIRDVKAPPIALRA